MSAPPISQLDFQQCIRGSFDEANGRLRVDAELTASIIPPPGLEVSILSIYDNIAIRNSNNSNELLINADGSINVNAVISLPANSSINLNQVAGVATAVNNGTANNGTQRVVIASDNTPFTVNTSIDAFTKTPADNSLSVGTEDGTKTGTKHALKVDSNKNLNVINMGQLVPDIFDEIDITNTTISGQVVPSIVVYKELSSTVATLTLSYDGNANITGVVRT